jgi:hypothetical protein
MKALPKTYSVISALSRKTWLQDVILLKYRRCFHVHSYSGNQAAIDIMTK